MRLIKRLLFVLAFISIPSVAVEFNNSSAPYNFSQTVQIFIVDQKNSKLFGMFDPFEMKVTTIPSRFYVAVMGALERGHQNAEGVALVEGAAVDYEYVLIFRSLNSSHILFIGTNWIIDGNKKILLSPQEIVIIYEELLRRSDSAQTTDLQKMEGFFQEINAQQTGTDGIEKISADDELTSIVESKKSLEERLPEGHNDVQNLPYYNKALENQKFLEEYNKTKKSAEEKQQPIMNNPPGAETASNVEQEKIALPPAEVVPETAEKSVVREQAPGLIANPVLLLMLIGLVFILLYAALYKRRRVRTNRAS